MGLVVLRFRFFVLFYFLVAKEGFVVAVFGSQKYAALVPH